MKITDSKTGQEINCLIEKLAQIDIPKKKDGWSFNWRKALKESPNTTLVLKDKDAGKVQGAMQLRFDAGMLIMEIIELAPNNIGKTGKYSNVAGCLIAYACREAIKLDSAYRGYLTFQSKTKLVNWYKENYYASQAIGLRMYIDPKGGEKLIKKYLEL